VFTGLKLAWSKGYRKIIVESDSAIVMDLITEDKINIDRNYCLIMKARNLLAKEEVQTTHVYREANSVPD
jgi:ribonuclease HI